MKIDTNKSSIILAHNTDLEGIVEKYTRKTAKRKHPWNVIWLHANVGKSLELLRPMTSATATTGHRSFLIVIPSLDKAGINLNDRDTPLFVALRVGRHHGISYALGFSKKRPNLGDLHSLASHNLFHE